VLLSQKSISYIFCAKKAQRLPYCDIDSTAVPHLYSITQWNGIERKPFVAHSIFSSSLLVLVYFCGLKKCFRFD
jgi:hypothetical protein